MGWEPVLWGHKQRRTPKRGTVTVMPIRGSSKGFDADRTNNDMSLDVSRPLALASWISFLEGSTLRLVSLCQACRINCRLCVTRCEFVVFKARSAYQFGRLSQQYKQSPYKHVQLLCKVRRTEDLVINRRMAKHCLQDFPWPAAKQLLPGGSLPYRK